MVIKQLLLSLDKNNLQAKVISLNFLKYLKNFLKFLKNFIKNTTSVWSKQKNTPLHPENVSNFFYRQSEGEGGNTVS